MPTRKLDRRRFTKVAGAIAMVGLAGCADDDTEEIDDPGMDGEDGGMNGEDGL